MFSLPHKSVGVASGKLTWSERNSTVGGNFVRNVGIIMPTKVFIVLNIRDTGWVKVAKLSSTAEHDICHIHHMGHFPQDGENEQNVSFFSFFWSFTVTKRFDFLKFSQLFWRDCARWIFKKKYLFFARSHCTPCSKPLSTVCNEIGNFFKNQKNC